MISKRKRIIWGVVGSLCAIPIYWLQLSYVVQFVTPSPSAADRLAAAGALTLAMIGAWAWSHSLSIGAMVQIALLLPAVVGFGLTFPSELRRAAWGGGIDYQFFLAFLAIVILPGALLGFAVLALRHRTDKRA